MSLNPTKLGLTIPIHCPVRLEVKTDPLGPVNQIVSLVREDGSLIKSALCPVPAESVVKLGYDPPRFEFFGAGWQVLAGGKPPPPRTPRLYTLWTAEVDGRRVLEVPEHDAWLPIPPMPTPPLWHRMRTALRDRLRADVDAVAKRLGYHRDEDCGGWDE